MTAMPAEGGRDEQLRVRLWLRLLAGTNTVIGRLRRGLRDEFGMTLPGFDLMAQIQRPPHGPTMSELSRRLMVTKGNVSDLVERLEGKGLVERRADPADGRVQHIDLTADGEALLARMLPLHRAWLSDMMAAMDETTLTRLHDLLGEFKDSVATADKTRKLEERRAS